MEMHFLPGFLGLPLDWLQFEKEFIPNTCFFHHIENYLTKPEKNRNSFLSWATKFNSLIFNEQQQVTKNEGKNNLKKRVLVGYSLGGRLALHALISCMNWDAAIIISANPGLINKNEKLLRQQNDKNWAQRFLKENWSSLLHAWNTQDIFSNIKNNLTREENNYDRKKIAQILTNFSLGKQKNLRTEISILNIPILWISGELDKKFTYISYEMSALNSNIKSVVLHSAGHRVPWENPEEFILQVKNFLLSIGTH